MMKKTVGIFGGGQLGCMLAQAALPFGVKCVFLEDIANCPASVIGEVFSTTELNRFLDAADVFTLEFENTAVAPIATINDTKQKHCFPNENVLSVAQDRLQEKNTFVQLDVATVPFQSVESINDLKAAMNSLGLPMVIKTSRGGYDGKGQFVVRTEADINLAWQALGEASPLIAEGFIDFDREVSIIAVRDQKGVIKTYPLVENHHYEGILSHSIAPAPWQDNNKETHSELTEQAEQAVSKILNHFNYVGVLTLELFVTSNGILANEIAPRVHNSGHWSIEGAVCSQFENHMRAVLGLPLGSTDIATPSVMFNIIGEHPDTEKVLAEEALHLHFYGKTEREGRKLGHITKTFKNEQALKDGLEEAKEKLADILPNSLDLK